MTKPICQRILLKLSGEALVGETGASIDADIIKRLATEIKAVSYTHLTLPTIYSV